MLNQYAKESLLVGVGLALVVAALAEPAVAQTSDTNCHRVGNQVYCQTTTMGLPQLPSGGLNIDWNAGNDQPYLGPALNESIQRAAENARANYQANAALSALHDVDYTDPASVQRAVGALIRAGAFQQARELVALHNSLMARNAELAPPTAPASQIAESQRSAGVTFADAPATRSIPAQEIAQPAPPPSPASFTPSPPVPASAPGYWLLGTPMPPLPHIKEPCQPLLCK